MFDAVLIRAWKLQGAPRSTCQGYWEIFKLWLVFMISYATGLQQEYRNCWIFRTIPSKAATLDRLTAHQMHRQTDICQDDITPNVAISHADSGGWISSFLNNGKEAAAREAAVKDAGVPFTVIQTGRISDEQGAPCSLNLEKSTASAPSSSISRSTPPPPPLRIRSGVLMPECWSEGGHMPKAHLCPIC